MSGYSDYNRDTRWMVQFFLPKAGLILSKCDTAMVAMQHIIVHMKK